MVETFEGEWSLVGSLVLKLCFLAFPLPWGKELCSTELFCPDVSPLAHPWKGNGVANTMNQPIMNCKLSDSAWKYTLLRHMADRQKVPKSGAVKLAYLSLCVSGFWMRSEHHMYPSLKLKCEAYPTPSKLAMRFTLRQSCHVRCWVNILNQSYRCQCKAFAMRHSWAGLASTGNRYRAKLS